MFGLCEYNEWDTKRAPSVKSYKNHSTSLWFNMEKIVHSVSKDTFTMTVIKSVYFLYDFKIFFVVAPTCEFTKKWPISNKSKR